MQKSRNGTWTDNPKMEELRNSIKWVSSLFSVCFRGCCWCTRVKCQKLHGNSVFPRKFSSFAWCMDYSIPKRNISALLAKLYNIWVLCIDEMFGITLYPNEIRQKFISPSNKQLQPQISTPNTTDYFIFSNECIIMLVCCSFASPSLFGYMQSENMMCRSEKKM